MVTFSLAVAVMTTPFGKERSDVTAVSIPKRFLITKDLVRRFKVIILTFFVSFGSLFTKES
jgi:hypothetical protein